MEEGKARENLHIISKKDNPNHFSQEIFKSFDGDKGENTMAWPRKLEEKRKQKNRKTSKRRKELSWKNRRWGYKRWRWHENHVEFIIHEQIIDRICKKINELAHDGQIITLFKSYGIEIKESGMNYKWLCPWHVEKSPSFTISKQKGVTKCFGCGEGKRTRRVIFELEFGEGVKYKKQRLLQLEQKIDAFCGKEKISQYSKILKEKWASAKEEIEGSQRKEETTEEEGERLPF